MSPEYHSIRTLQMLYAGIITGSGFFIIVSLFIVGNNGPLAQFDTSTLFLLLAAANIAGVTVIYAGINAFKNKAKDMARKRQSEKMEVYKSAMIIRVAMFEGTVFFFVILYLLSGYTFALAESIVFIVIMGYYFPTVTRIAQETGSDPRDFS